MRGMTASLAKAGPVKDIHTALIHDEGELHRVADFNVKPLLGFLDDARVL